MQSKALRLGAYAALFIGTFVVGLILTLPTGLMARVVETQIEQATNWKYDVSVESVRINGLIGLRLNGVSLQSTAPPPEGARPLPATMFDRIQLRANPLSLIGGRPKVRLRIDAASGRIVVHYRPKGDLNTRARIEFHDVNLQQLPILWNYTGRLPVSGVLRGTIELGTPQEVDPAGFGALVRAGDLETGTVELGITNLRLGPGQLRGRMLEQAGGFLPLDQAADLGTFVARLTIESGQINFDQFEFAGNDMQFTLNEGRIELRQPFGQSRIQLQFAFDISDEYIEAVDLGMVFNRLDFLNQARSGDGYALAISGSLANPGTPQPLGGARGRR